MIVYVLYDENGEVRYVGQTTKSLEERIKEHLWSSSLRRPGHKNHWLRSMLARGERPTGRILQGFNTKEDLDGAERYWIRFLKERGCRLVNDTDGGEGLRNPSPETRARMSAAKAGKPSWKKGTHLSLETREKIRQANLGKRASEETKRKMSEARRGRPCKNPEAHRLGRLGWRASLEQRERMRQAAQLREAKKRQQSLLQEEK